MTSTNPGWSEEELRWIEPLIDTRKTGARGYASRLRAEISDRSLAHARAGDELTRGAQPSVVYAPVACARNPSHGNFIDASYRRIVANPEWAKRLKKAHSAKRQARPVGVNEEVRPWRELDCANSSDALLMNIFCYPKIWEKANFKALFGVQTGNDMVFGYKPRTPLLRGLKDCTEIDMRVENLLLEAKLTESDFQFGATRLVERYLNFDEVFQRSRLQITARGVRSYQLVRGVMAAHALGVRFCVLSDARRPDLQQEWYEVMSAVRSLDLRARLQIVTWQEVAAVLPSALRRVVADKYGISSG